MCNATDAHLCACREAELADVAAPAVNAAAAKVGTIDGELATLEVNCNANVTVNVTVSM